VLAGIYTFLRMPHGWLVYVLRCADGTLYTGITNDLERRLGAHACGKASRYTRSRLPVKLLYRETARGRGAALRREHAIKSLSREEKLRLVRSERSR
jgi:putative endonuclease